MGDGHTAALARTMDASTAAAWTSLDDQASTKDGIIFNSTKTDTSASIHESPTTQLLWQSVGSLLLLLGTIGNVLVVVVIACRPRLRAHTAGLYLVTLAVLDLLVLYSGLLRNWVLHLWGLDVRHASRVACKAHLYATYACIQLEAWVLVNISLERVIAIYLPHRSRLLLTPARARLGLLITGVIVLLLNLPYLIIFDLASEDDAEFPGQCVLAWVGHSDLSDMLDGVDLALSSALPSLIMAAANVAIVTRLGRRPPGASPRSVAPPRHVESMTAWLLAVSITFIVCTVPHCVFLVLVNKEQWLFGEDANIRLIELVWTCLQLLMYASYCLNFLLYCLSGSKFRHECAAMFGCARRGLPASSATFRTPTWRPAL